MGTLRAEVERLADGSLRVALRGALDESTDMAAAFAGIDGDVVIDLIGIERVNSIGIHRWVPAIGALSERHRVTLERVPYPLVLGANAVANLFGSAKVASCLGPYFCDTCGESRTEVVLTEEVVATGTAPARTCRTCAKPLSFDELDTYFRFLRRPRRI